MVGQYEGIRYFQSNNIGHIQLDRPPVNAFSPEMGRGLYEILKLAQEDNKVRVVVLSGTGEYFSTGMDLKSVDVTNAGEIQQLQHDIFNPIAQQLYTYQKPTICALNGTAAGAGLAFALGCDMMYAQSSARLVFNTIDKGLLFACGGGYLLERTVGERRAKEILFRGTLLTVKEGLEEKLVTKVFRDVEDLNGAVEHVAGQLAEKSSVVLSAIKSVLRRKSSEEFKAYLQYEEVLQRVCLESKEFQEAMKVFLKK